MKKLVYLLVCACFSLISCDNDDTITLTVDTSAYDVVKDLKDIEGNLYFTDKLADGLQIRISYLVLRQDKNQVSIVSSATRYISDIKSIASYTTDELEPGEYSVIVASDFVKGNTEFNEVTVDNQYEGFSISCSESAGVYNAFGTAYMSDITVDSKKTVTLNTIRRGSLVTFLLKNTDRMTDKSYSLTMEKFTYTAYGHFAEDFSYRTETMRHTWTTGVKGVQHYCATTGAVIDPMVLSWQGTSLQKKLSNGKDVIFELDFASGKATSKP